MWPCGWNSQLYHETMPSSDEASGDLLPDKFKGLLSSSMMVLLTTQTSIKVQAPSSIIIIVWTR